jgi:hypothetical protein
VKARIHEDRKVKDLEQSCRMFTAEKVHYTKRSVHDG